MSGGIDTPSGSIANNKPTSKSLQESEPLVPKPADVKPLKNNI